MILMVGSFGIKQVLVDFSLSSASSLLEAPRLEAEQREALSEIDAELDPINDDIAELERDPPKRADDTGDQQFEEQRTNHQEALQKLQDARKDQSEKLEERRAPVRNEYRAKIREATRDAQSSVASGLGRAQWVLFLKTFLDLAQLLGSALVMFAGLHISLDKKKRGGAKAFATVMAGIAFVSLVIGSLIDKAVVALTSGLWALFS